MRRQRLPPDIAEEVTPKNILMIGPTGVGKTEIARRLARLAQSPFIKVEASKFTEVGYVGRDVESMVRDLVELAVDMVRSEKAEEVQEKAREAAEERLLDLLLPPVAPADARRGCRGARAIRRTARASGCASSCATAASTIARSNSKCASTAMPSFEIVAGSSVEEVGVNLKDMMGNMFQGRTKSRRLRVPEALEHLVAEEQGTLVDMESVSRDGRPARRAGRHHLHRRNRQDREPRWHGAAAGTARTSAAKACSATSCRSSKGRRSTPSTAW